MEKLIELLNEFNPSMEWRMEDGVLESKLDFPAEYVAYRWICSKNYGFIKWLVDNEKIDFGTRNPLFLTELVGEQEKQIPYSFYEEMLIRLALSDTPIEDLISYLK